MKRKVNRVGQNTLTVSLPSKWAKEHNIQPGSEVELKEEGKNLYIEFDRQKQGRTLDITLNEAKDFMTRIVCGPYLKGYKSITFHYKDPQIYALLLGALKHTIGFEIVDQTPNTCTLAEISTGADENYTKIILRLFNVLHTFATEVKRMLAEKLQNHTDLLQIEYTCDRLSLYCRRLVNQDLISGKTYDNTAFYHVVCLAEQVGDELRHIVEYFKKNKDQTYEYDQKLDLLFAGLFGSIDFTMKKLNNYIDGLDYQKQIIYAHEQRKHRMAAQKIKEDFLSYKGANILVFHHLINTLELIQHMSEELF